MTRLARLLPLLLLACNPATPPEPTALVATPSSAPTSTPILSKDQMQVPSQMSTKTPIPIAFPTPVGLLVEYSPNLLWGVWEKKSNACGNELVIQNLSDEKINYKYQERFIDNEQAISYLHLPMHWSLDGNYLYFSLEVGCIDGGPTFRGVTGLLRLDLSSGEIEDLLPHGSINVGISADSQYLAYISGSQVAIRDLFTDQERVIDFEIPYQISAGDIVWSPESLNIVFVVETSKPDLPQYTYTMVIIDVYQMEYRILVEDFQEEGKGYWFEWVSDFEILLTIATGDNNTASFSVDTLTGELTSLEE